jgi:hypothetical protein
MIEFLLFWLLTGAVAFCWHYGPILIAVWREPALRRPVVILESDDWGPGPPEHADRLRRLAGELSSRRDGEGHAALMTIGVILAIPDGATMRGENFLAYRRLTLDDERFSAVRLALEEGQKSGAFALQLHGLEHYWPDALMAVKDKPEVGPWLSQEMPWETERLPAPLQSRWIRGDSLPSGALEIEAIERAAREEVEIFAKIFFYIPSVVVPPTFIWREECERAWTRCGIRYIITPGNRYSSRNVAGKPMPEGKAILNGQRSADSGALYLVRDIYFEPAFGHTARQALTALEKKTKLARPALYEMHRFNFIASGKQEQSLSELGAFLDSALAKYPDLLFIAPAELALAMETLDPRLIETSIVRRALAAMRRLRDIPRMAKLAWLSGIILPAALLYGVCAAITATRLPQNR